MRLIKTYSTLLLLSVLLQGCGGGETAWLVGLATLAAVGAGAGGGGGDSTTASTSTDNTNNVDTTTPAPTVVGGLIIRSFDGETDDLLTAGVGSKGLSVTPSFADPINPTALELRRRAIVNQYQVTYDMRNNSGFGRLYGPAIAGNFAPMSVTGKISGKEFLRADVNNRTQLLQLPNQFDLTNPCLIAVAVPAASSVYAGIPVLGEWGLKNRCAVVYTDKGTGNAVHDIQTDTVSLVDGTRTTTGTALDKSLFTAKGNGVSDLAAFASVYPERVALKQVHSQTNPEKSWDQAVLDSIDFAFEMFNRQDVFGQVTSLGTSNTVVIAAGLSTGGAAVLRAAEIDAEQKIDGVLAVSPTISFRNPARLRISQGIRRYYIDDKQPNFLATMATYAVYQPCASSGTTINGVAMGLPGRCNALGRLGLISNSNAFGAQLESANEQLAVLGTLSETQDVAHFYTAESYYTAYANAYANAYGRFSVVDNLCDYSYGTVGASQLLVSKSQSDLADEFATGNGISPSSNTTLLHNRTDTTGQAVYYRRSSDANNLVDGHVTGALCLQQLAQAQIAEEGSFPTQGASNQQRVQDGLKDVLALADLRGKAAIIVHGRADPFAHVNLTSRAYFANNKRYYATQSQLVYLEVDHAHHIDALNQKYQLADQVPLMYYAQAGLDQLFNHLQYQAQLPGSQVIASRGINVTDSNNQLNTRVHLPPIGDKDNCVIRYSSNSLIVPECDPDV